jgi:hypothetical protein
VADMGYLVSRRGLVHSWREADAVSAANREDAHVPF